MGHLFSLKKSVVRSSPRLLHKYSRRNIQQNELDREANESIMRKTKELKIFITKRASPSNLRSVRTVIKSGSLYASECLFFPNPCETEKLNEK